MFQMLKNFGVGGLASDPFEENASPLQWTRLSSVDFVAGDITSPGQDILMTSSCPITTKWMFAYTVDTIDYLFVSDGFEVWSTSGGQWTLMIDGWHGGLVTYAVFLGSLVVNSHTDGPYYWNRNQTTTVDVWGTSTTDPIVNLAWQNQPLTETWGSSSFEEFPSLPGWFAGATCLQMVAYKNFLVALAVNDPARSNDIEPYLICWSDAAPAGGVPGEWDPLPTNLAGDTLAQDTPGSISAGEVMRDDLNIYKTDGQVYRLTYVGGTLVMQLQRLYQGFGVDYPGAVANCAGLHYLTTRSGLMVFDGQTMHEMDFARVQERVRSIFRTAEGEVTYTCAYPGLKQIWTAYRVTGDVPYAGILKYDISQNCFTNHEYSGDNLTSMCPGRLGSSFSGESDTWIGGADIDWNAVIEDDPADLWNKGTTIPLQDTMFLAVGGGVIARYDPRGVPTRYDGSSKNSKMTRYGIRLGDNTNRVLIRGIYPLAEGTGLLKFTVGKSWSPWQFESPTAVQWGDQRSFTPGVDRFLPMRVIGDSFALEVTSDDGNSWSIGGIGVEYEPLGHRG